MNKILNSSAYQQTIDQGAICHASFKIVEMSTEPDADNKGRQPVSYIVGIPQICRDSSACVEWRLTTNDGVTAYKRTIHRYALAYAKVWRFIYHCQTWYLDICYKGIGGVDYTFRTAKNSTEIYRRNSYWDFLACLVRVLKVTITGCKILHHQIYYGLP